MKDGEENEEIKMEFSVKQNQMSRDSWIWKEKIDNDVLD